MEEVRKYFAERDKLGQFLGVELLEVAPGYARCKLEIREHHLNGVRMVHGGTIFSLADIAFAAAVNTHGTVTVAINVSINFIRGAGEKDTLYAEAREIDRNSKLSNCEITVANQDGVLIATFTGLAYCKKDKLPVDQELEAERSG